MRSRLARAPVTTALLAIITIIVLLEMAGGAFLDERLLIGMGAITGTIFDTGEYWRLLAAMFLHGNLVHWLANTFSLYQLGTLYEALFGSKRFTLIYFATGIVASIASAFRLPLYGSSVGASGAIFGILGAFIFSIRRSPRYRNEPWTKSLTTQLVFWAIFNIILGLQVKVIDNTAHIAGLVSGLILGAVLPHGVPPPPPADAIIEVTPSAPPQNQP